MFYIYFFSGEKSKIQTFNDEEGEYDSLDGLLDDSTDEDEDEDSMDEECPRILIVHRMFDGKIEFLPSPNKKNPPPTKTKKRKVSQKCVERALKKQWGGFFQFCPLPSIHGTNEESQEVIDAAERAAERLRFEQIWQVCENFELVRQTLVTARTRDYGKKNNSKH